MQKKSPEAQKAGGFLLSCQGSNLDSTESKSGVLPVTPQDNSFFQGGANVMFQFTFLQMSCKKSRQLISKTLTPYYSKSDYLCTTD